MIIFKKPRDIILFLSKKLNNNISVGFVPTMGALHMGHIALVKKAVNDNDTSVCSIFVNPSQFNDPKDFEKYPRTLENDVYLLEKAGCDVLFLPTPAEIYPDGMQAKRHYDLDSLEDTLEGKYRPGHFQGVCQVVHRLLEIVNPDKLYIGQKDFQQCLVIKKLVELLNFKTDIIISPTLREADGLAMSSRNLRLSPEDRTRANNIYKALLEIQNTLPEKNISALKETAVKRLTKEGFKVDYIEIADRDNLVLKNDSDDKTNLVALAAAFLNNVRLIDNIILN